MGGEGNKALAMTSFLYTGTPGSGKSVHMANEIYWHVKMHRPVVANFDINSKMFKNMGSFVLLENKDLRPEVLIELSRRYFEQHKFAEGTINLYIDEAQVIFGNRDWQKNGDWIAFFTQHRKLGYDVKIVCQNHEMIDKHIRSVIEYEIVHKKANNVGWVGRLFSVLFLGHPVFCAVKYWYGQKMRLSAEWFVGRKRYYKLYDSYKLFDSSYGGKEKRELPEGIRGFI